MEEGIGEFRYVRIEAGSIIEARIRLPDARPAGWLMHARLASIGAQGRNAIAIAQGREYLVPQLPSGVTEGARVRIEVTREAIPGSEPWKRPIARVIKEGRQLPDASSPEEIPFPSPADELEDAGWSDILDEARSRVVRFEGGELQVSLTPAMTLIDVDGYLPPTELVVAGAAAAAKAIRRHGIGGSIGIDLPTIEGKAARQAAAAAIDEILPQPFERTAVNGFGFLQIVRPRPHASLFELAADRAPFEARALLRRLGREVGAIRIVAHPAVITAVQAHPVWLDLLARQIGGAVTLRADAALAMSAGHAERA